MTTGTADGEDWPGVGKRVFLETDGNLLFDAPRSAVRPSQALPNTWIPGNFDSGRSGNWATTSSTFRETPPISCLEQAAAEKDVRIACIAEEAPKAASDVTSVNKAGWAAS